jgi:hypothetical protein
VPMSLRWQQSRYGNTCADHGPVSQCGNCTESNRGSIDYLFTRKPACQAKLCVKASVLNKTVCGHDRDCVIVKSKHLGAMDWTCTHCGACGVHVFDQRGDQWLAVNRRWAEQRNRTLCLPERVCDECKVQDISYHRVEPKCVDFHCTKRGANEEDVVVGKELFEKSNGNRRYEYDLIIIIITILFTVIIVN